MEINIREGQYLSLRSFRAWSFLSSFIPVLDRHNLNAKSTWGTYWLALALDFYLREGMHYEDRVEGFYLKWPSFLIGPADLDSFLEIRCGPEPGCQILGMIIANLLKDWSLCFSLYFYWGPLLLKWLRAVDSKHPRNAGIKKFWDDEIIVNEVDLSSGPDTWGLGVIKAELDDYSLATLPRSVVAVVDGEGEILFYFIIMAN